MPTPSLIIPSAPVYDEGLLYGLNVYGTQFFPEPIPFTRATTATRTNAAGLIELAPYNLLQYSEQFDNANYTKDNVSILANVTTAPNGTLTADKMVENTVTGSHRIYQTGLSGSSGSYTLSCYAKQAERYEFRLSIFDGGILKTAFFNLQDGTIISTTNVTATITNVDNGWYRCTITGVASPFVSQAQIAILNTIGDGTSGLFIWGAQLVEGTDALPYLKTETRLNRPRVDFSLGGCPNLLLEPQRTNLILQSSSFDNASWVKNEISISANSTTSPSGVVDADTLTANGTSNPHLVNQVFTLTSGTTYTCSFYVKKSTNNFVQLYSFNTTGGQFANFDINSGVVGTLGTTTGSNPTSSVQSVGNGWYRCSMTFTAAATASSGIGLLIVTSASAARLETNTLTTSVFIWGAQLEAGAYSTTFIPTTTASVTRNADSFVESNVFSRGMITAAGGTWFMELRGNVPLIRDASGGELYIGEDANSAVAPSKQSIAIRNGGGSARRLQVNYWNGSSVVIIFQTTTDTCKIAIKFTATSFDVFENGVKVTTAQPISWTLANVQNLNGLVGVSRYLNQMELFPTPLTDGECIALTTL